MKNNSLSTNISLGMNAVLLVAVIVLFVRMPKSSPNPNQTGENETPSAEGKAERGLVVGFYNGDSLNRQSDFIKALQTEIQTSTKKAEQRLVSKQRQIEKWQQKWKEKGNLLPSEREQYMKEAAEKEQELARFQQKVQVDAATEQEQLMLTLYTRLANYSQSFAQQNKIDLLFQYQAGQNIMYCHPDYDFTSAFVAHVNEEYNSTFEAKEDAPKDF